jgi:YVTN family beta-propeller protein
VAAGASTITVNVVDTANSATPAKSPAFSDTRTITVNADISLTSVTPDPAAATSAAVIGRPYGKSPKSPPVYTFAGGIGSYTITTPTKPGWMTCTAAATTLTCDSGATTVAAGPSDITVNVVDTANSTTPAISPAFADGPRTITVNAALAIALAQNSVNLTGGAPAILAPGVTGRTYARGAQATTGAVDYTGTGGLGSSSYRWCISAGAEPGGFVDRTLGTAVSATCGFATSTVAANITLEANPVTGGASTYNFTMQLDDGGNTTTPDSIAAGTSSPQATRVVINADISLTGVAPDPAAATSTAVVGRTYGKAPKSPPVYTFAGGIGSYTITTPTIPGWMTCTAGATTLTCDSGATTVALGASDITVNVVDTANAATPARSTPFADGPRTITVNAALAIALTQNSVDLTGGAPAVLAPGVTGRTYARGAQSATGAVNYTGAGGTGSSTYRWCISAGAVPAGFVDRTLAAAVSSTCTLGGSTVAAAITLEANPVTGGASTYSFTMQLGDGGNNTTPDSFAVPTSSPQDTQVVVSADISLTGVAPDPGNASTSTAVVGRTYGKAPKSPPVYTFAGGLGSLTITTPAIPAWMTCTPAATTLTCDSGATTVASGASTITVNVVDTANVATPAKSPVFSDTRTITVNLALSLSAPVPDPADTATTTAVVGRAYGIPAGLLSPTYTASNGITPYTLTVTGSPGAGITCTTGATTVVCDSAAVTSAPPTPFDVDVTDSGNSTTPADTSKTPGITKFTRTFTVKPEFTITTLALPNGLKEFTYVPPPGGAPGALIQTDGQGLGGYTWVSPGSPVAPCSGGSAPSGTIPAGLTLAPTTGILAGVPTAASTLTSQFTFNVCAYDAANTTTPSGAVLSSNYTVNIMDTFAYAAGAGSDTVEVVNTGTNASVASISTGSTTTPHGVAVSADGRRAYVTLSNPSANAVAVIDTITNSVLTTISFASCIGPQGVTVGTPSAIPTAFVACSNQTVAVIDDSAAPPVLLSEITTFGTGGANFYGISLTPDELFVYVTDAVNNEFVVFDASLLVEISGSPFAAGVTTPHGIAFNGNALSFDHAYIAGSGSDDVAVIDTSTNGVLAGTPISTGSGSAPESIAVTPSGTRFYVTLNGSGAGADQFAVFDDGAPPTLSGPFSTGSGTFPFGVTVPPLLTVPVTGLRVYITPTTLDQVLIFDDATFSAHSPASISLVGSSVAPRGIAHIPVPR